MKISGITHLAYVAWEVTAKSDHCQNCTKTDQKASPFWSKLYKVNGFPQSEFKQNKRVKVPG